MDKLIYCMNESDKLWKAAVDEEEEACFKKLGKKTAKKMVVVKMKHRSDLAGSNSDSDDSSSDSGSSSDDDKKKKKAISSKSKKFINAKAGWQKYGNAKRWYETGKRQLISWATNMPQIMHGDSDPLEDQFFGSRSISMKISTKMQMNSDQKGSISSTMLLLSPLMQDAQRQIELVHANGLTIEMFRKKFEERHEPCIIQGLADHWKARASWSLNELRKVYGECRLKCGEDDDGYPLKVKLKHFMRYLASDDKELGGARCDDSPLYVFASGIEESKDLTVRQFLNDFQVPHIFSEDLFHMIGEKRRPPYRWVLVGPERSGTTIHIDPLGTSAWNTLVRGRKLWALFPPHLSKDVVKGRRYKLKGRDDEAVDWFLDILPRMLNAQPELKQHLTIYIQTPGETIYVPSNWWHAVINLDDTVAVTQNFSSTGNFNEVWRETRVGRKRMAEKWLSELEKKRPDLAKRARELNEQDGYNMEEELRLSREKKKQKKKKKSSDSSSSDSSDDDSSD